MVESAIVLYGNKIIDISLGTAVHVEFGFENVWEFKRTCKDFYIHNLHFIHVHPEGFLNYSMTDLNCIQGLNLAFGDVVLFSIVCFKNSNMNDLSYGIRTFFYNKEMVEIDYDYDLISEKHLTVLKSLSYYGVNILK